MKGDSELLTMRRMVLGAAVLVVVQSAIGMVVNLFVSIPPHHSGANPANFLTGSFHSLVWAIGHGTFALVVHAVLGLALVIIAISVTVRAISLRRRSLTTWSILAVLFIIGAGFNGMSFLDFNLNVNSLIMALLALSSVLCYLAMIYLLPVMQAGAHDESGL
jgi:hypothetical protein